MIKVQCAQVPLGANSSLFGPGKWSKVRTTSVSGISSQFLLFVLVVRFDVFQHIGTARYKGVTASGCSLSGSTTWVALVVEGLFAVAIHWTWWFCQRCRAAVCGSASWVWLSWVCWCRQQILHCRVGQRHCSLLSCSPVLESRVPVLCDSRFFEAPLSASACHESVECRFASSCERSSSCVACRLQQL